MTYDGRAKEERVKQYCTYCLYLFSDVLASVPNHLASFRESC